MRTAAIWFAQESSPSVPDEATRLRLLTGAMGTQDLKLAYANWLTAVGASASWEQAQSFLLTQVPWRDLPVQAMQSILNYSDMKVRDGKDVSNTLISYITGFQNQRRTHGALGPTAMAAPPEHGGRFRTLGTLTCVPGGGGGDVDIRLHILPAPRLYIGAIPGNGRL
jgi:hypothetical protein